MTPSVISNALRSIVSNAKLMQNQSPLNSRESCASAENRQELELLDLADTVLADNNWRWLHHLLDLVHDIATQQRGKMYFACLFKSQDAAGVELTLSEMETWHQELGDESARPREHDLARALFLLGYDKSLSLTTL